MQVVGLAGPRDLDVAFRLEVEIGVKVDADVRTRALPEGREALGNGGKRRAVGVKFGMARAARKTRLMHAGRIEVEAKDVGLERLETRFPSHACRV